MSGHLCGRRKKLLRNRDGCHWKWVGGGVLKGIDERVDVIIFWPVNSTFRTGSSCIFRGCKFGEACFRWKFCESLLIFVILVEGG